jgi:hypothetical protein
MKKPKPVIEAEAALSAKAAEVSAAKETLNRLENELSAAHAAVRQAQTEADASMPQCRMVSVNLRTGGIADGGATYVIVRRAPRSQLFVRRVGDASSCESRFKWCELAGNYRMGKKGSIFTTPTLELRDVPAEYMPAWYLQSVKPEAAA